jgi:hypothetical protein
MLTQAHRDLLGSALAGLLVGGYALLSFAYPELALRTFKQNPTPNKIKFAKVVGPIELALVLAGFLAYAIARFL